MFSKQRCVWKSGATIFCSIVAIINTFSSFHLGLDFDTAEENKRGSATSSSPSPNASLCRGGVTHMVGWVQEEEQDA